MENYLDPIIFQLLKLLTPLSYQATTSSKSSGLKNRAKTTKMLFLHAKLAVELNLRESCFKNKVTIISEFTKEVLLTGPKIMALFVPLVKKIAKINTISLTLSYFESTVLFVISFYFITPRSYHTIFLFTYLPT